MQYSKDLTFDLQIRGGGSMSDGFIAIFSMGWILGVITALIIMGVMKRD